MKKIIYALKTPFLLTVTFMIICGIGYPLLVTGLGQTLFPYQANGSQIKENGKVVGSALIGQAFTESTYLKGRPSGVSYNTYTAAEKENGHYLGVASGSENLAPSNPNLKKRVAQDMARFLDQNPTIKKQAIPTDLMTASGSGLDPHISPESAKIQVPEIAKASKISEKKLYQLIDAQTTKPVFNFLGTPTVNVLAVNLAIHAQLNTAKSN
ncbi:potassium translocating ATPase, subunit C [Lactococcus piscium]|uniref:potassium-transporting ATPase subunit KdpC n=1 Tax=Pseudolactococcus carnosus TaxID=2749961 RepID=UPI000BC50D7C|nr:potassium-transporting ATPase subunit KdpC [Lactococcus carnosus]MCJ2001510.1 potassium-transporting ATPase subunit KdpC [Lactococcus carnosus]SOB47852.1 potassium translocating ATPase, subunit C [Lactococcus piscium]